MTDSEAPLVIIPRRHQSAPKEHWSEKELRKAAEEIDNGQFQVPQDPDEFFNYGPTQFLARHPRVQEALAKLELEKEETNSQEAIEKAQMYFELNERAQQHDKWDGQGRWIGKENEEMRRGELLTPYAFIQRLQKVIGESRVQMNDYAVDKRAALFIWKTNFETATQEKVQVGTLQYPLGTEWMILRFNEYGVPTTAKYLGWRTALLSMIKLRVITEKEAHKAFPLKDGPASAWYREQLAQLRTRKKEPNQYAN